ncbi:M48 family metallopeptidase [Actinopolymorpha alba]|uniref:M48 family metallopeptidase n=1 Tax=Actinopolymorpha alba TaxID=533267 RepID=UPI00047790BC|nr:M48 family metallopeptidase [Actinopolymorpha alba]
MATGWRAAIAVSMLAGFYVLALAVVGALGLAGYLIVTNANGGLQIVIALVAAAVAILVGLAKALKRPRFTPHGVQLLEHDQPQLWAMVRDLAARVVTRPPDEIWLVPEVNAAVTEDASMLGLRGGRRYLLIGLPLLLTLNADQLRAVLGHELGHYSHAHTRLGEINYRGRITIGRTIEQLNSGGILRTLVRKIFELYARLYFLVESTVSRRQELEADQAAAAVAGRVAMQTALRELPVLVAAWNFYLENYVSWALDYGIAPREVFAGFPRLLQARHAELANLRGQDLNESTSRWDSHPSTADRIAALHTAPDSGAVTDPRPAWALVAGMDRLLAELERSVLDFGDRQLLDWPAYTANGILASEQRSVDAMFRALSRVTGRVPESFATILAAGEAGRLGELTDQLSRAGAPEGGLGSALVVAAVRSGVVQVEHRWDRPAVLRFADGEEFDPQPVLDMLASGPDGAARVRNWLPQVGIDPSRAAPQQARADAATANVVGAMANLKVGKQSMDLVITDEGFVFTPCPKSADKGKQRLTELIGGRPVAQLATEPGNVWIPYEEIASATLHRAVPVKAALALHNGTTFDFHETMSGEELGKSSETLRKVLENFAERG